MILCRNNPTLRFKKPKSTPRTPIALFTNKLYCSFFGECKQRSSAQTAICLYLSQKLSPLYSSQKLQYTIFIPESAVHYIHPRNCSTLHSSQNLQYAIFIPETAVHYIHPRNCCSLYSSQKLQFTMIFIPETAINYICK